MSRSMKIGITTIIAAFVVSMVAPEDAEARYRRLRRRAVSYGYSGGCCGVPQTCCGVAAAPVCHTGCETGACGVATSACPGGVCGVASTAYPAHGVVTNGCPTGACTIAGGTYSGAYSAGYGQSVQGTIQHQHQPTLPPAPQGTFDQSAPPAPGVNGATNGAQPQERGTSSPSDRSEDRPLPPPAREGDRAAPPPPQEQ
jgi:hypothetical protein